MSKRFATMPKGEARPLGTPRPKKEKKSAAPAASLALAEKSSPQAKKSVDDGPSIGVSSEVPAAIQPPVQEKTTMQLTLKGFSKNGKTAFYTGAANVLRFARSGLGQNPCRLRPLAPWMWSRGAGSGVGDVGCSRFC